MHGIVIGAHVSRMFQNIGCPLVLCVRSMELIEHRKQIYTNAKKNLQEHAGLLAHDHICEKV
jgi:hypothetical protein